MYRPFLFLPTAVFLGNLVLGCSDLPTPPESNSASQASFRAGQKSEGSGAQITRSGFQALVLSDPDRDFVITVGLPQSEWPECGGPDTLTAGKFQSVLTPADVYHEVGRVRQETLTLYGRYTGNPCELTEADVVARGRGNATITVLARAPNVLFGIWATGKVELTSGGLAHLVVKGLFHIEPDGSLRVHVDRFKLQPIGG